LSSFGRTEIVSALLRKLPAPAPPDQAAMLCRMLFEVFGQFHPLHLAKCIQIRQRFDGQTWPFEKFLRTLLTDLSNLLEIENNNSRGSMLTV
jgi:hypothetical protein